MSLSLQLTENAKTKFGKYHRNTFGLMFGLPENGGTCPGATSGKGGCLDTRDGKKRQTCYMVKIVQIYKAVGAVLLKNTELVQSKHGEELEKVLQATVDEFRKKSKTPDKLFMRLHYSGDFYDCEYAQAWANVMKRNPDVQFWAYTRSFTKELSECIGILVPVKNLTLFLSCDPDNYQDAKKVKEKFKTANNLGLAWLGENAPADYRWVTCPETSGVIKNTDEQGACAKCRLCVNNYKTSVRNIKFCIH